MNCAKLTNDLLLDYADWELPPHERNRIARHLDVCPVCRTRRDDLEGMAGALRHDREVPPAALLEDLDAEILRRFDPAAGQVSGRPVARRCFFAAGAAATLLLAAVAWLITAARQPSAPVATAAPEPAPEPALPEAAKTVIPVPPVGPPVAPKPRPAPVALRGDLNDDGAVDIADARIIQQIVITGTPAPAQADVNDDGTVDIADVRAITRHEVAAR